MKANKDQTRARNLLKNKHSEGAEIGQLSSEDPIDSPEERV